MIGMFVTGLASFIFYLALTAGSGSILLWSAEELAAGAIISLVTGAVTMKIPAKRHELDSLNPLRWIKFVIYLVYPFAWEEIKSNIDVALRVITGDISPGIVKIHSKQDSDLGLFMLASSITLTPGTLTIDSDEKRSLHVHCINVRKKDPETEDVCGGLAKGVRWVLK